MRAVIFVNSPWHHCASTWLRVDGNTAAQGCRFRAVPKTKNAFVAVALAVKFNSSVLMNAVKPRSLRSPHLKQNIRATGGSASIQLHRSRKLTCHFFYLLYGSLGFNRVGTNLSSCVSMVSFTRRHLSPSITEHLVRLSCHIASSKSSPAPSPAAAATETTEAGRNIKSERATLSPIVTNRHVVCCGVPYMQRQTRKRCFVSLFK